MHLTRYGARCVIALLFVITTACASVLSPAEQAPRQRAPLPPSERDVEFIAPDDEEALSEEAVRDVFDIERLSRYEVAVIRAAGFDDDSLRELDAFTTTEIAVRIADRFDLLGLLPDDELEALYRAVSAPVPLHPEGVYRAVIVGQFFDNGAPLYLLLGSYETSLGAAGDRRVIIQSNAVAARDGRVATGDGRFISISENISWDLHLGADGRVAMTQLIQDRSRAEADERQREQESIRAADETENGEDTDGSVVEPEQVLTPMMRIVRAGDSLLDGNEESTREILSLVEPVWQDSSLSADLRLSAGLVLMRYHFAMADRNAAVVYSDAIGELAVEARNSEVRRMARLIAPFYRDVYELASRP